MGIVKKMTKVIQNLRAANGQEKSSNELFWHLWGRKLVSLPDRHVELASEHLSSDTCVVLPSGADGLGVGSLSTH